MPQSVCTWCNDQVDIAPFIRGSSFIVLDLHIAIIVHAMREAQDHESHRACDNIMHEVRSLRVGTAAWQKPRPPAT
ncbi:hypothetical protein RM533_06695 [Croceicoccus sp. F390]|uniref:Uncharacterized protein n=1 Tax=Croceicoccus esteveae TaxID=3075597 RepID=A0ABU2ZHV0_9SPHN|nr:hypothetical protein [Croceicoccus sp. F390]MDT0575869.1 hypothetical protein [Croceicoccus sp. F390]